MEEQTLFAIEGHNICWYIDLEAPEVQSIRPYRVSADEHFRQSFKTLGEALAYVFQHQTVKHFKAV